MTKACPFCGETILQAAKKCKHCGEFLDPQLAQQRRGPQWDPVVAAVLNLVLPGAGYIYIGQIATGILNILVAPVVYLVCWSCAGGFWSQALQSQRAGWWYGALGLATFLLPILVHLSMVMHPIRIAKSKRWREIVQ